MALFKRFGRLFGVCSCLIGLMPIRVTALTPTELFRAVSRLDIPTFYSLHTSVIDFTIFLVFFLGAALVAFREKFPGRGGKALVVAIAIVLSLSLTITERAMGFSIKSFGFLAAATFLGIVAILLLIVLSRLGVSKTLAGSITFILLYFSVQAISPGLADWVNRQIPWAGFLFWLAIIFAVGHAVVTLWPFGWFTRPRLALAGASTGVSHGTKASRLEVKAVKSRMVKPTKSVKRDASKIASIVRRTQKQLGYVGQDNQLRAQIITNLQGLEPLELEVLQKLRKLEQMDAQLKQFDLASFASLRKIYRGLPSAQRSKYKKRILAERKKLAVEDRIEHLGSSLQRMLKDFDAQRRVAVQLISAKDDHRGAEALKQCLHYLRYIKSLATDTGKLEKDFLRLAKSQAE